MSARLSIVLSQAGNQIANGRDIEGELVADLIGAAGMDLSLIGPLEQLGHAATDRLVIDGLTGDFALLTWDEPAVSLAQLTAASVPGYRAPHQLDPEPAANQAAAVVGNAADAGVSEQPTRRRIYCFNLREHSIASVRAGLEKILLTRQTPTISLGSLAASSRANRRSDEQQAKPLSTAESPSAIRAEKATATTSGEKQPPRDQPSKHQPAAIVEEDDAAAIDPLDALVDDLNAFDI
ncbi:hypothetical protein SH139x_000410 [Planctomycetaceae bacterium SH139]